MELLQLLCSTLLVLNLSLLMHAQQLDHVSPLKTFPVFHRNQFVGVQPSRVMPSISKPTVFPAFGGTPYTVGATVSATSTKPEAEEEIAADPLDDSMLVAAISDFSLRGGFNTTKCSLSANNGST